MTMNATNSYLQACRYFIEADLEDPGVWVEIQRHLSSIRLALTCCVCGRLLNHPMGPAPSVCHHYVCKDCIGGKMRYIKRGCGWCKSFEEFVANGQLDCVVRCFQQLCQYVRKRTARILTTLAGDTTASSILTIIQEATADRDSEKVGATKSSAGEPGISSNSDVTSNRKSESFKSRRRVKRSKAPADQDSDKEICFNYKKTKFGVFNPVNVSSDCLQNNDPIYSSTFQEEGYKTNLNDKGHYVATKFPGNGHLSVAKADSSLDCPSELHALDSGCDSEKMTENFVLAEHDYNKCTGDETDISAGNSNCASEQEQQPTKKSTHVREYADAGLTGRRSKLASALEHVVDQALSVSTASNATPVGIGTDSSGNIRNSTGDLPGRRCKNKEKSGCRCALATPNPGKLTCCGQRCPCYAAFKGCDNCKCRGCRNPRGDPRNIPGSLLRAVATTQTMSSTPHSKISATVT